jgi:hypothetical protein
VRVTVHGLVGAGHLQLRGRPGVDLLGDRDQVVVDRLGGEDRNQRHRAAVQAHRRILQVRQHRLDVGPHRLQFGIDRPAVAHRGEGVAGPQPQPGFVDDARGRHQGVAVLGQERRQRPGRDHPPEREHQRRPLLRHRPLDRDEACGEVGGRRRAQPLPVQQEQPRRGGGPGRPLDRGGVEDPGERRHQRRDQTEPVQPLEGRVEGGELLRQPPAGAGVGVRHRPGVGRNGREPIGVGPERVEEDHRRRLAVPRRTDERGRIGDVGVGHRVDVRRVAGVPAAVVVAASGERGERQQQHPDPSRGARMGHGVTSRRAL